MILWFRHSYHINRLEGVVTPIKACKSGHFMFVALSVKNNVGHPSRVIIFVISLL
jgi:hypothetical protein